VKKPKRSETFALKCTGKPLTRSYDYGGHGQNASHRGAQKWTTGNWGSLAAHHPSVSAALILNASDGKIV